MEEKTAKKENLTNVLEVLRNVKTLQGKLKSVEERLIYGGYTDSQEKTVERFISSAFQLLFWDLEGALYPLASCVEEFETQLSKAK